MYIFPILKIILEITTLLKTTMKFFFMELPKIKTRDGYTVIMNVDSLLIDQGSILIYYMDGCCSMDVDHIDKRLNNSGCPTKKDRMLIWQMYIFPILKIILEITTLLKTTLKFFCGTSKIKTSMDTI